MSNREELHELTSQLNSFKRELDTQTQSAASSQRKVEKDKQNILNSLNDYKIKVSNLEHTIEEKDQKLSKLEQSEKTMTYEIKELGKFIKEYTSSKEKDTQELKSQVSELTEKLASARSEGSKRELEDQRNHGDDIKSRDLIIEELRVKLDSANQQLKSLTAENTELTNEYKSQINDMNDEISKIAKDKDDAINALKSEGAQAHKDADVRIDEKIKSIEKSHNTQIEEFKFKNEELRKVAESTEAALKLQIQEKGDCLTKVKAEVEILNDRVTKLQSEKANLENKAVNLEAAKEAKEKSLETELERLRREVEDKVMLITHEREVQNKAVEEGSKRQLVLESDKITIEKQLAQTQESLNKTSAIAEKVPDLESVNSNLAAALLEVEAKLSKTEEILKDLQLKYATSQTQHKEIQQSEESIKAEAAEIRDELERRDLEFINIQTELERVNSMLEMAESTIQDKDKRLVESVKLNNMLQEQTRKFHDMLEDSERELSRLTSQAGNQAIQAYVIENQQLKSQLQSMSIEFDSYKAARIRTGELNGPAKAPYNGFNSEVDNLRHTVKELTAEKERLYASLKSYSTAIESLEKQNYQLKTDLRGQQSALMSNGVTSNDPKLLREQINQLQANQSHTSTQLEYERIELEKYKSKHLLSEQLINNLKDDIRQKTDECDALKKKITSLRETTVELIDDFKANEDLQQKYKNSAAEVKILTKELESIKKRHEEDRRDLKRRIDHNKKLTEAYEKQRADFQQTFEDHRKSVNECGQLKNEIIGLKEKTRELEGRLREVKS